MPGSVIRKVLASQPLLKDSNNDSDQLFLDGVPLRVFAGEKVKTGGQPSATEDVDGKTITWVFAEATSGSNVDKRKGFVDDKFLVDEATEVPEVTAFDPFPATVTTLAFADACYVQAALNKTNPAYLYALAFAQSGGAWSKDEVKAPAATAAATTFGVYQFTKKVWDALLLLPEAGGLAAAQIKRPTAQCVVAAILAAKSADLLKGLITDRALSAVDLYLAFMFADDNSFGSNSAVKILDAEKADSSKPSLGIIQQIYPSASDCADFIQRNQAIFGSAGQATIAEALQACVAKLTAGFAAATQVSRDIQDSIPASADGAVFGTQYSGNVIAVTDQDVEALARVSQSEVGNFGQFGDDVLTDALAAVVDTIFNRVVYPTKEFPKTIQDVINQSKQFSAINELGSWKALPAAPAKNAGIVLDWVQKRARGTESNIKGATHFFNPDTSNPSWGGPIRANPIARYGTPKNSHIHGFPTGYHAPEGYAIQLGKDGTVFAGDGRLQGPLIIPDQSGGSIVAAALKEWEFWGKSVVPGSIHHTDNEIAFATYVRDTYCKPLGSSPSLSDIANDVYYWSAVAISYMVRQAGIPASQFTFSEMHSTYIRESIKARKDKNNGKAYWGFRLDDPEAVVGVGDIVGAGRSKGMTFAQAQALFDRTDDYPSHSDIVVAVRPGSADLIGGNVSDSVSKKTINLDSRGRISDRKNLSFVVMKKK